MASLEYRPSRGKPYRVRFVDKLRDPKTGEIVVRRCTKSFDGRDDAVSFQIAAEVHEQENRGGTKPALPPTRRRTVEWALDRHMRTRTSDQLANVADDQRRADFIGERLGHLALEDLARRDVSIWVEELRTEPSAKTGRPRAASTVKNLLNLLRTALDECVRLGDLATNVASDVKVRVDSKERKAESRKNIGAITPLEYENLVRAAPEPWCHVLAFAVYTGLRQGEQWSLRLVDIIDDDGMRCVRVEHGSLDGRATKSGKTRVVPLLPQAAAALDAWLAHRATLTRPHPEHVFCTNSGAPLPQRAAPRGWDEWRKAAGIKRNVRWHDLRHTCGTWLAAGYLSRPWDILEVRDMLGHANVATTERYSGREQSKLRNAVRETAAMATLVSQEGPLGGRDTGGVAVPLVHRPLQSTSTSKVAQASETVGVLAEPLRGFEPRTYGLRNRCSTN